MPHLPAEPDGDEDLMDTIPPDDGPPQDVADLDDEMKGLLGQLDETSEDYVTERMVADAPGVEGDTSPPLAIVENPKAGEPAAPVEAPRTAEVRKVTDLQTIEAETPTMVAPPPEPVVDIKREFEQFNDVAQEVLQGVRFDRQEVQDGINLCRAEIQKAVATGHNPSRMWVDNLAKLLEIKATVNLTGIKALEAKTKLLAATKAGVQVGINNVNQQANVTTQADASLVDLLNSNQLDSDGEDEY